MGKSWGDRKEETEKMDDHTLHVVYDHRKKMCQPVGFIEDVMRERERERG